MAQTKLYIGHQDPYGFYNVYGIEPQSGEHVDFAQGMSLEDARIFVKASNTLLECVHPIDTLFCHAAVTGNADAFRCSICNTIVHLSKPKIKEWEARHQKLLPYETGKIKLENMIVEHAGGNTVMFLLPFSQITGEWPEEVTLHNGTRWRFDSQQALEPEQVAHYCGRALYRRITIER